MKTEEFESYDGLGLAGLVRSGDASAAELLDTAIARVEARNPELKAVVWPRKVRARDPSVAALPDGPPPACCPAQGSRRTPYRRGDQLRQLALQGLRA
jgi:hypothetical protein